MTKREFSEKAFREYLDSNYRRGIEIGEDWYKDAKDFQKKSNTTFRCMYNDWIDQNEKENGYNSTGVYS